MSGPLLSYGSKFVFSTKVGTLVRVYIKDHSFPHKNARLFFEGALKEIVQRRNPAGDLRFRDGYVILRGNFSTRLGGKWKRSEHKKIAIGDITRIIEVKHGNGPTKEAIGS